MIQAYCKYKPASFEALALLVYADGKDRMTQAYIAEMLRVCAMRPQFTPPSLQDMLKAKSKKAMTPEKGEAFVDNLISTFLEGGEE